MCGALATVCAFDLKTFQGTRDKDFLLYTLGAPRIGNPAFADKMFDLFPKGTYYRIVHKNDIVPFSVPRLIGFQHAGDEVWYYNDKGKDFNVCENFKN